MGTVTFKRFGIKVKFVTDEKPETFAAAIDEKTKAIYIESISNPKFYVPQISELAKVRSMHCQHSPIWMSTRLRMTTGSLSLSTTLLEWEVICPYL